MPLGKNATVGDYIHDFQSSTNPMFAGKSPEKRRQMAIAASYHGRARGGLVNHFAPGGMWGSNLFQPPSTGAPSPQGGLGSEGQGYSPFSSHMQRHHYYGGAGYGYRPPPTPQMFMGTPGSQGPAPPQMPAPAPPPMPSFQKTMGQVPSGQPGLVSQPNIDYGVGTTPQYNQTADPGSNPSLAYLGTSGGSGPGGHWDPSNPTIATGNYTAPAAPPTNLAPNFGGLFGSPAPAPSFSKTMGQETPAPAATPSFSKTMGQEAPQPAPIDYASFSSMGPGGIPNVGHWSPPPAPAPTPAPAPPTQSSGQIPPLTPQAQAFYASHPVDPAMAQTTGGGGPGSMAEGGLVDLARNMRHGKDEPEPSDHAVLMPIVPQMGEPPMSGTLDAMTRMHENRKKAQGIPGSYAPGGDIPGLGPNRMPIAGAHLIHSDTPGRTDRIRTQARPGSFIIPADVVSGVGQGNTQAGAKIFGQMIATGPYGASMPKMGGGRGAMRPPKPPALHAPALHAPPMPRQPAPPSPKTAKMMAAPRMGARALRTSGLAEGGNVYHRWSYLPESQNVDDRRVTNTDVDWGRLVESMKRQSSGGEQLGGLGPPVGALSRKAGIEYIGRQEGGETETPEQETQEEEHTPIITAGGEVIIDPEVVQAYGGGDIEKGKDILSKSVVHMRKQIVEQLRKLPGPIQ